MPPQKSSKKRKCEVVESPAKPAAGGPCVFCQKIIEDSDSKLTTEERQKLFEATCMFLSIPSEDYQWDFEKEPFPFCHPCTTYVQEFGALYDEMEVVHLKIARVVENVKQVVSSGSDSSSSRTKRTRRGSADAKLQAFRQQLTASLRIGEDTDEAVKNDVVPDRSPLKEGYPSSNRRSREVETEAEKQPRAVPQDASPAPVPSETIQEDIADNASENHGTSEESESEEVDEFEAYVKEQLKILKAKGLEKYQTEDVIPIESLMYDPQIKVEGFDEDVSREEPLSSVQSESTAVAAVNGKNSSAKGSELSETMPETTGSKETESIGFGTVTGERYRKFISVPKPNLSVSAISSSGFMYGTVNVITKGRAYHCSLCPEFIVYDDKDLILDHVEMAHIGCDHWYPCEYCDLNFRLVGQLRIHRKSAHAGCKDRKYTIMCPLCTKRFFDKDMATEHANSDHQTAHDKVTKILHNLKDKGDRVAQSSTLSDTPATPSPTAESDTGIVVEPSPFQLRPRRNRKPSYAEKPDESDPEEIKVESESDAGDDDDDSGSDSFEESPVRRTRSKRASVSTRPAKPGTPKGPAVSKISIAEATKDAPVSPDTASGATKTAIVTPMKSTRTASSAIAPSNSTKPDTASTEIIPLQKLVLCGGCGCRYFSETTSAVTTISRHAVHHKNQKAFPCRLCSSCFSSLPEMIEHVRGHSQEPRFKDYFFYSPPL